MSLTKQNIYTEMRRVFDGQYANQKRYVWRLNGKRRFIKDTDGERGVFWSSVATAGLETLDPVYRDAMCNYALHTGFRPGPIERFADDQVCIQGYMDIYPEFNLEEILEYSQKSLDIMLNDPKPGEVDGGWCDALFMAPGAFAAFSKVSGDPKYFEYAYQKYFESLEYLRDKETGLIYRDKRYIPNDEKTELREANGKKVFGSRGIAGVLASVPRVLRNLEKDDPRCSKYIEFFQDLAPRIAQYQFDDGFGRASLLDPQNFPNPESSATGLFLYGLAWGVNQGYLDKETYLPKVIKAGNALVNAVHPNGMLGGVQLPAFNPRDVKFEDNIDYGAGAFLLAGCEVAKLFD